MTAQIQDTVILHKSWTLPYFFLFIDWVVCVGLAFGSAGCRPLPIFLSKNDNIWYINGLRRATEVCYGWNNDSHIKILFPPKIKDKMDKEQQCAVTSDGTNAVDEQ